MEIHQAAPNKWISRFKLDTDFVHAYDGSHGWSQDNGGFHDVDGKDLIALKQDAEFYRDLRLNEMFPEARTSGRETINGRDSYVVGATSAVLFF